LCTGKYKQIAASYVSRDYFPIDECLEICEREKVVDACAILYKRKGEFKKSIELYVEVLTQLSEDVIIAVYVDTNIRPFNDPGNKNESIRRFDELLTMIIDICDKHGSRHLKEAEAEELWLYSIEQIYLIKRNIIDNNTNPAEQEDLRNFKVFLLARI
jgi:tetratricopeptide (TPR) repeat protein